MILDAAQDFTLPYPGGPDDARAFLRDPARSLAGVRFLHGLSVTDGVVRAELLVSVPMLGQVTLPFASRVQPTEAGARLDPIVLDERLWAEVAGDGHVDADARLHYALRLRAHLDVPQAQRWGGAAFEKMLRETARRTLERVARDFPAGVAAAANAG